MIDIFTIIREMKERGDFDTMMNDPMIQFGDPMQGVFYLGATLLPEEMRMENKYNEMDIQFQTLIADDSTPYSPPQAKKASRAIHMDVELGSIDAKRTMEAEQIDKLNHILNMQGQTAAETMVLGMIRTMVVQAKEDKKELKRWQSFRDGEGKYISTNLTTKKQANYNPPSDLRFDSGVGAAGQGIKDDSIDPIEEVIIRGVEKLRDYGYETMMIVCRSKTKRDFERNQTAKDRASTLTVTTSLQLARNTILNEMNYIDEYLTDGDIPPIVTYDGYYRDAKGQKFYLKDDEIYFFARTPRTYPFLTNDNDRLLEFNRIGYYGIGKCQNQTSPGEILKVNVYDDGKPDYFEALVDSRSLPVIQTPDAICVIKNLYNV